MLSTGAVRVRPPTSGHRIQEIKQTTLEGKQATTVKNKEKPEEVEGSPRLLREEIESMRDAPLETGEAPLPTETLSAPEHDEFHNTCQCAHVRRTPTSNALAST